jgi:phosphoheptose isomerase
VIGRESSSLSTPIGFRRFHGIFTRAKSSLKTATTWRTDYEAVFKKFVPGSHVTAEALLNIILSTEANTRTRLRACTACGAKPTARACALREIH